MGVSSADKMFYVSGVISVLVLLSHCEGIKINVTMQCYLYFTQAEIATQKNKGLTPIKKVS